MQKITYKKYRVTATSINGTVYINSSLQVTLDPRTVKYVSANYAEKWLRQAFAHFHAVLKDIHLEEEPPLDPPPTK